MDLNFVDYYINKKLEEDEKYIICSFYELRVKYDLTEEFINEHLPIIKNKLRNMKYNLFFRGDLYLYHGTTKKVKENQHFVAIKE